jgi:bacitracin synthase 3
MDDKKIVSFLKEIRDIGIRIAVKNNELDVKAPKGVMTKEILSELKILKPGIIAYLSGGAVQENKIEPVGTQLEYYPISSAQRRLWILSQFEDGSIAFNIPSSIKLAQNIDIENFKKAIDQTIQRHEILRTIFKEDENGEIKQWILSLDDLNFEIEYRDYRNNAESNPQTYIDNDSYIPFNLESGPLLRAALLQVAEEEYVFYFNMHHIISDGWSMEVLAKDVFTYYDANVSNSRPALLPLPIQYKDYSVWQLEQLNGNVFEGHKKFWLDSFSGELPLLNLPTYKQRPRVKTHNGLTLSTYINAESTQHLKDFAKANGGSNFMGVLAAWNVLMHYYTAQNDFIIGTPVAGRDHADLEDQIGFYVNTLALRNELDPQDNFKSFYTKVKNNTLQSYNHQAFPFDRLVEELDLKRDTSRNPIFDVSITYHNITADEFTLTDESLIDKITLSDTAKVKSDIELHFNELGDYMSFSLMYNEDVYDQNMLEGVMVHFKAVLAALLSNPEQSINSIDYLTEDEKSTLIESGSNLNLDFPKDLSLVDLFEEQAKKNPNRVAVVFEGTELTYNELDQRSNQLAHFLLENYQIKSNDLVGIQLERSDQMVVTILGVLKAGGAYVPIDPEYPSSRKEYIVQDSDVKLLITNANFVFDIDYYDGEVFAIDVEFEPENYNHDRPEVNANITDLAYVIYTSGSTGQPKGVMIQHQAIVNTILAQIQGFEVDSSSVGLQFASFSFDASVSEIFFLLLAGGKLCIVNEQVRKDPNALMQFINQQAITIATLPPSYLSKIDFNEIKGLKKLITAGEAANYEKALAFIDNGIYFNAYGPTETSICGTIFRLENKTDIGFNTIPIGSSIANVSTYILNDQSQLLPPGVFGEICIGGAGLAKGYLNKEELTNEKFINNPFIKGERLYKTGDLGRWLPDGNIEYLGRKDEQVKIKGYRIELGEIEHFLSLNESIESAVVLAKPNESNEHELVAYMVAETEQNINDLRTYLKAQVPEYMVPLYFVQLDEMPLTPNGKIDKKALPNPEGLGLKTGVEYVAPQTENEKELVAVWTDVLKREEIGIKDSFYNLGGDSIKSIQVVSRLKQKGYSLKVENILQTPVLEELAVLMVVSTLTVDQSPVVGEVELTPIQHWFFESDEIKVYHHYNQSVLLRSNAAIDSKLLEQSIAELTVHHDVLRMVFEQTEGKWKQVNQPIAANSYTLEFHDLSSIENPTAEVAAIGEQAQASIDLNKGPIFKVVHFRLKDGDRVGLILHHLVVDGVSWRILLEDLSILYTGYKTGVKNALALKTDGFQKWASVQKEYANSNALRQERPYWEAVAAQEIQGLVQDITVEDVQGAIDARKTYTLDKATTELLQTQVHHVYNTEINDVLLTGLGLAIKEVMGVDKTVLKMEGHGREDIIDGVDITRTVGWFTSVYPYVLDVSASTKPIENLVHVKEDLRKIPNKGIGYGMLKHLTEEGLTGELVPEIVFNYLGDFGTNVSNDEDSLFEYAGEYFGAQSHDSNGEDAMLEVSGMLVKDELTLSISYSKARFNDQTIEKLNSAFKNSLTTIIHDLAQETETFLTPADLSYKGLTIDELSWINSDNSVEDVYELSPLQEGIYYHWLFQETNALYFEQTSYRINAKGLEIDKLKKAYDFLLQRHGVLRTSFTNDYARKSLQIVRKHVDSNFTFEQIEDRRDKEGYVKHFKQLDIEKGFDLASPSQMRMHVIQLSDQEYEFIWSHHHILMDGWCMSVLINDFNELLSNEIKGLTNNLPPAIPYAKYINWLNSINKQNSLDYWKDYLAGYDRVAQIPFREKNTDETYAEANEYLAVKGDLFQRIDALCSTVGVTNNSFVQAVWGYLLSRYNNTNDVVFGAVVSGRPAELNGVEEMIGLFINTIPVRVNYDKNATPVDCIKKVQAQSIKSTPHHYLNLSEVQAQSDVGTGLINHIMVFENYAVKEMENEGVLNTQEEEDGIFLVAEDGVERNNFNFNFRVIPSDQGLTIHIKYNGVLYDGDAIKGLLSHLNCVINNFVDHPNEALSSFNYLSATEKATLLDTFNSTVANYPANKTVVDLFEEQVEQTPNSIAVVFDKVELTYAKLNEKANQLGHYLQSNYNIKPDDLVGFKLPRNESVLVAILGILKSGGAYVPIDSDYPAERVKYIEKDANCKVCIDQNELDKFYSEQANYSTTKVESETKPNNLAYVVYTSGSTGKAKGVMIEHRALINYNNWFSTTYNMSDSDSSLLISSPAFDGVVTCVFGCLLNGGAIHVLRKFGEVSPVEINAYVKAKEITFVKASPSHFNLLIDPEAGGEDLLTSPSLRLLMTGGDTVDFNYAERIVKETDIVLINHYGPTETTVGSIAHTVTKENLEEFEKHLSIGSPIDNTEIYILSEEEKLQPVGIIGEIAIAGDGLARGYLNQEELTKQNFVPHPFKKDERIYKTGDLARWLPNGTIEFLGRMDDQVQVRGYRIELGEIEQTLSKNEEIEEVAVLVIENKEKSRLEGKNEIVAYITADKTQNVTDLRTYLKSYLPDYMLPAYFVQIEEMPLTPNGKIDKKRLPNPNGLGLVSGVEYIAPRTELEEKILAIWEMVLGRKKIGVRDDFFEVGGHSLSAMGLVVEYKASFNIGLTLQDVYDRPQIEAHAELIEIKNWIKEEPLQEELQEENQETFDF